MIRRPPRSTLSSSSAASDVYKRQLVGRPTWLREQGVDTTPLDGAFDAAESDGATAVMAAWNGVARGVVVLRDPLKATSAAAIDELRAVSYTHLRAHET